MAVQSHAAHRLLQLFSTKEQMKTKYFKIEVHNHNCIIEMYVPAQVPGLSLVASSQQPAIMAGNCNEDNWQLKVSLSTTTMKGYLDFMTAYFLCVAGNLKA